VEQIMQSMADRGQIDPECLGILLDNREQRQAIAAAYSEPVIVGDGVWWVGEEGVGPRLDRQMNHAG
jgi:hypothetical protein